MNEILKNQYFLKKHKEITTTIQGKNSKFKKIIMKKTNKINIFEKIKIENYIFFRFSL